MKFGVPLTSAAAGSVVTLGAGSQLTTAGGVAQQPVISMVTPSYFGSGSDGAVTISGNTTLTKSKQYTNLAINAAVTLTTNSFAIYGTGTLTFAAGTSRITSGTGFANGQYPATNNVAGGASVAAGAGNPGGAGVNPNITSTLLAAVGGSSGAGGFGGNSNNGNVGGAGGSSANPIAASGLPNPALDYTLAYGVFAGGAAGGGGGSGGANGASGAGGNGGAGGGVVVVIFNTITGTGTIDSNASNGTNGGAGGFSPGPGAGGGGGGGGGGVVVVIYATLGTWTTTLMSAVGGNGGAPGVPSSGTSANGGGSGSNGNTYAVQVKVTA